MLKVINTFIFCAVCFIKLSAAIITISSLSQISENNPPKTLYLFDIDDTLLDSTTMLGSKNWRKYIKEATKKESDNWHDIFSLFIARNHPFKAVEPITSDYVEDLQQRGHDVFGLTSRERNMWYATPIQGVDELTINQLKSIGITFKDGPSSLTKVPEFYKGVFFADLDSKGDYLLKLLKDQRDFPPKIIFVDDKLSQVESVEAVLNELGIENECYVYLATDEKAKKFDCLIANIQLYYFWMSGGKEWISDEKALSIAQDNPEMIAEEYLRDTLFKIPS